MADDPVDVNPFWCRGGGIDLNCANDEVDAVGSLSLDDFFGKVDTDGGGTISVHEWMIGAKLIMSGPRGCCVRWRECVGCLRAVEGVLN